MHKFIIHNHTNIKMQSVCVMECAGVCYPFVYWKLLIGYLCKHEDPDEMTQNAAFHQGLHCLLNQIQTSGTELHNHFEISTCDPLK